jgi:prepilin-type N-terminal cleavage/methylation domain-containing protein
MIMRTRSRGPARSGARAGFSLVETLVGLTMLSIALVSVAKLDYNVMRRTNEVSRFSYGNASLLRQVNRFVAINYDSLDAHAGCVTVNTGHVPNSACATITTVNSTVKQVTIVLRITGSTAKPDTVIIQRSSATAGNPFNTP